MCDQTEVSYLPNDVVWVKLGNVWWPAQVQDESQLDEEVTSGLRKKPLAVVKFFDEDLYEFPKNINQIYHYNCFKKDEFIKKGLDMVRPTGYKEISANMKKFPTDIKKAEILTGGNPDIVYDPKYLPEEKFDYREQFGMKPRKRTSAGSSRLSTDSSTLTPKQPRVKFSTPVSAPSTSRTPEISFVLKTKSLSNPLKKTREIKKSASSSIRKDIHRKENESHVFSSKQYKCNFCDFTSGRMGVLIEHYRGHYSGLIYPSPSHIPHNYSKIFHENFIKFQGGASGTPVALPKFGTEKTSVKRKINDESSPIKKRKQESQKKEKTPAATPTGSVTALAVPIKDIVGSAATPKKRPRKSKEPKTPVVKEPEALDILKDWEDDMDEEIDIKLSQEIKPESLEDSVKEPPQKKSNNFSENEEILEPHKANKSPPASNKEKCCFDFEDNDESLSLNKSLKFGQKLPRVISEEKPTVQRLLKELKESSMEVEEKDVYNQEFESLLKTTEVPEIPDIPCSSLTKPNEKSIQNDLAKTDEKEMLEITESESSNKNFSDIDENKLHDLASEEQLPENVETSDILKNDSIEECNINIKSDSTAVEEANSIVKSISPDSDLLICKDISVISSVEEKEDGENKDSTGVKLSTTGAQEKDGSNIDSFENAIPSHVIENIIQEETVFSPEPESFENLTAQTTPTDIVNEVPTKLPEIEKKILPLEEFLSSTEQDVVGGSSESFEKCHESVSSSSDLKEMKEEYSIQYNKFEKNEVSNEDLLEFSDEARSVDKSGDGEKDSKIESSHSLPNSESNVVIDNLVTSSEPVNLPSKDEPDSKLEQNISTNVQTTSDQIPFDINSMPIVIDQDPIMEIVEGHVEPLPNADVVRLYIRNRGEEEPEDFQSPRRLLTVSPPPPNMQPIPGIKKIAIPPPKNRNINTANLPRYSLSQPPNKIVTQVQHQPQILFIKSTTGGSSKLLIPQQQGSTFAPSGKLQPGTRILTTNAHLVSKGPAQKKVASKQIIVGKQGFPTTAKVVQKSSLGQVFQKVSQQSLVANKNSSTVLVNAPKTIVGRPAGRNVLLTTPQLKNPSGAQVSQTGGKVVRTAQVIKTQGSVFKPGETVLSQKSVQSPSGMNETKKLSVKNKLPSPNILQKTQRKPGRQQIIKKSQVLTVPSSVQQATEVVAVNNLPIVQTITSHSSSEPVKMLYLTVDNSQYSVKNTIIPVENDNQNIFVTSSPSSGNVDNIIFSIDGTGNLVNISNQTPSSSTHSPTQDILAKALANTQVLQSEATDIVESDNAVFVDQQYPAPSLSNTVLETSLTLNQPPIMTPLEVPSSVSPQSNISHIIPITNVAKKSDIQQPSMPLLTDEVEVPAQAVFLSDSSGVPTTSGHLTFQLVNDNNIVVTSGLVQEKSSKTRNDLKQDYTSSDNKEDNVLPEFLKGNFGNKSDISKKDPSPKCSER